jgi:hypothetical protein
MSWSKALNGHSEKAAIYEPGNEPSFSTELTV